MRPVYFSCLLLAALTSCKPRKEICSQMPSQQPAYVTFSGYARADLDTIFFRTYAGNSGFSTLTGSDTLITDSFNVHSSGALVPFPLPRALRSVGNGEDLEVTLPAVSRTYRIAGYHFPPLEPMIWESERCGRERTFIDFPEPGTIDGVAAPYNQESMVLQR